MSGRWLLAALLLVCAAQWAVPAFLIHRGQTTLQTRVPELVMSAGGPQGTQLVGVVQEGGQGRLVVSAGDVRLEHLQQARGLGRHHVLAACHGGR